MPWDVKYVSETDTVELKHWGNLSAQDAREQAEMMLWVMKETQASRFLLDYAEAATNVPDTEIRALPAYCAQQGAPLTLRVALVVPMSLLHVGSFELFGRVARQHGFSVDLFPSREQAKEWLAGGRILAKGLPKKERGRAMEHREGAWAGVSEGTGA